MRGTWYRNARASLPGAAPRGLPAQGFNLYCRPPTPSLVAEAAPPPLRSSLPPPTRRTVCTMSKKGAKTQDKDQSYEVRDIVLAKVRGFPPWPGMVSSSTFLSRSRVLYVPRSQ